MMEEDKAMTSPALSISAKSVTVTEVAKDGDALTFIIVSQKLSGTGEYHVDRTYEDFEWLQQHLFSLEDVPGIQGVIFPPLPAKAQLNASAKMVKQLGLLATGDNWKPYCRALEAYLQQVAAHPTLNKNRDLETFLTSSEPPGRQKVKKGIFNRFTQAVDGIRKEGHKDVDEFFKTERDRNFTLTGLSKTAAEEMLFRRTSKLVELETASKNAERAKPVKKAAMDEMKKAAEKDFDHISAVAKQEWCEQQLLTAKDSAALYKQHLQAFGGVACTDPSP
ncbi:hypothetical protein CRUP_036386 [Coryphaenoides rupestris]|nr:hypothetical protein CRUP_036386 [Coryphaenoides rupestris]